MNLLYSKKEYRLYNLFKYIVINFPLVLVNTYVIYKLNHNKKNNKYKVFTVFLVFLIYYCGHILFHQKLHPNYNFHLLHHNFPNVFNIKHIEFLVNILPLNLILLNKLFNFKYLDNTLITYTVFLYTSVHLINYHILNINSHLLHHTQRNINYGPEFLDILFLTKKHNTPYENLNNAIINVFLLYYFLKP